MEVVVSGTNAGPGTVVVVTTTAGGRGMVLVEPEGVAVVGTVGAGGVVGGVGADEGRVVVGVGGGGVVADSSCMNRCVVKRLPPTHTTPTPTWVNAGSMMLALWPGLARNASMTAFTLGPVPTFSPTFNQYWVIPSVMSGAWLIPPAAAISSVQSRAASVNSGSTINPGRPAVARAWLTSVTNWLSSGPTLAAPASGTATRSEIVNNAAAIETRVRRITSSVPLLHAG